MSAIKVNEITSIEHHNEQRRLLDERAKILNTVSRKAQEKTLTIQEANDLYAKFNSTYTSEINRSYRSQKQTAIAQDGVDESWAIKLLKECEQENNTSTEKQTSAKTKHYSKPELYGV